LKNSVIIEPQRATWTGTPADAADAAKPAANRLERRSSSA
jgi:hypothetical protein